MKRQTRYCQEASIWTKVFLHFLLYVVVVPFSGALVFLVYRYLVFHEMSLAQVVASAAIGAVVGVPFVVPVGLGLGLLVLPFVLFTGRWVVLPVVLSTIMFAPWIVIGSDPYFVQHPIFIWSVSAALALVTSYVYKRCNIYGLVRDLGDHSSGQRCD